jgi:hypothetical protein
MGLFSFLNKASTNFLLIADSDAMMEKYVGENPYIYKNKFYNSVVSAAQEFQERLVRDGGPQLSTEERSAFRLAIFSVLAHNLEDFPLRDRYIDAARRLERDHEKTIRTAVSVECDRLCRRVNPDA